MIIDLTPVRDGTGPARLLDLVEGRSTAAFKGWLTDRPEDWLKQIEVVAMDGFTGFKTAAKEEVPTAVTVMDPFHVVRLDDCRRRIQQATPGRRGRRSDPLWAARRILHTGSDLLTEKQQTRLDTLFASEDHVPVEATWDVYQAMITAYRHPDRAAGRTALADVITQLKNVPTTLTELRRLGRTLKQRADDVLAYFDRPGTSNGPTEAINGRLEHLRGIALGFRNLTHYIARALLHSGGFRTHPHLHPGM